MRKWEKPVLKVEKIELSQAVAAGCGDFDYIELSCTANNANKHPNNANPYRWGEFVKNLSSAQAEAYSSSDWDTLLTLSGHNNWTGNHSYTHSLSKRNIPFNS